MVQRSAKLMRRIVRRQNTRLIVQKTHPFKTLAELNPANRLHTEAMKRFCVKQTVSQNIFLALIVFKSQKVSLALSVPTCQSAQGPSSTGITCLFYPIIQEM